MAKDVYHNNVKDALIKDGWTITHDPMVLLSRGEGGLQADLGAEKIILAEKDIMKIVVEVKSFIRPSLLHEFNDACGQYISYIEALEMSESNRVLYLAMPDEAYFKLSEKIIVQRLIKRLSLHIVLFNPLTNTIQSWIEPPNFKRLL